MQVEKDIVVACDFIEGNVYEKTGYRPVKLFSDQSLKSFKKVKLKDKNAICKINSSDELFDIISYGGNVTAFSDNRFDEYFMKLKIAALNLNRKDYYSFLMNTYGKYSYTFNYDIYKSIRNNLDDKTRYFFDELYKSYIGKRIRRSKLIESDRYSFEELSTLVRYTLSKDYQNLADSINEKSIKFIYSKDEKIESKVKELYDFIYLSHDITSMSEKEIKKREKLILESFRNMLSERGKIQCFYSDEEKDTAFDKIEYRSNPSVNNDMAYVYTYKNKEIEK